MYSDVATVCCNHAQFLSVSALQVNDLAHELQLPRPEVLDFLKSYVPGPRTNNRHGSHPLLVALAVSSAFARVCKHAALIAQEMRSLLP